MKSPKFLVLLVSCVNLLGLTNSISNNLLILTNYNGVKIYKNDYDKM